MCSICATLRQVYQALQLYYQEYRTYPVSGSSLQVALHRFLPDQELWRSLTEAGFVYINPGILRAGGRIFGSPCAELTYKALYDDGKVSTVKLEGRGCEIESRSDLNFIVTLDSSVENGDGTTTLTFTATSDPNTRCSALDYIIFALPTPQINLALHTATNSRDYPMPIADPDPITGASGLRVDPPSDPEDTTQVPITVSFRVSTGSTQSVPVVIKAVRGRRGASSFIVCSI